MKTSFTFRDGLLILAACALMPAAALADEAEAAWKEIKALCNPALIPTPPSEWRKEPPSAEAYQEWRKAELEELHAIGKSAREFYSLYPEHPHASSARILETVAAALTLNLESMQAKAPEGTLSSEEIRYLHYSGALLRKARTPDALSSIALRLERQYPGQQTVYTLLLAAAADAPKRGAQKLAERIIASEHATEAQKLAAQRFIPVEAVAEVTEEAAITEEEATQVSETAEPQPQE